MKRTPFRTLWVAAAVSVSIVGLGVVARGEMTPTVKALVDAERAFSAASVAKGTRDAFLEFLADDSLLFRPGPVPGKMFTRNRPAPPGKLVWAPTFADVASSGDIGYTSGPYEFRKGEMTEPPSTWGHYMSIWRKQKDGSWKVEVDLGISHDKFSVAVADVKEVETPPAAAAPAGGAKPAAAAPAPAPKADAAKPAADAKPATPGAPAAPAVGAAPTPTKQAEDDLKKVDLEFSKLSAEQGAVKAFLATMSDGVRIYRNGSFPSIGKAAVEKFQPSALGTSWQPAHARVSASGDFGYTTGMISMEAAPTPGAQSQPHYYVRLWRKDKSGAWKVDLDIVN